MFSQILQGLGRLILPPICTFCAEPLQDGDASFCPRCTRELTCDTSLTCWRCSGSIGEHTDTTGGCPSCRDERLHIDSCTRLGLYDGRLRDAILRMKNASGETLAACIGHLWGSQERLRLKERQAEAVIPIPLHWWRRLYRGYNQSQILAEQLSGILGIPCYPRALRRLRPTVSQTTLSPSERRLNVVNAFRARGSYPIRDKRLFLVDDVLTTGSTASEAAKALKQAGAREVHVLVLGHR